MEGTVTEHGSIECVLCQYYLMICYSNDVNVRLIQEVAALWAKIIDLDWLNPKSRVYCPRT